MPEPRSFSDAAPPPPKSQVLLTRAAARCWALPLGNVIETMRPLPAQWVSGMPVFVQGNAIIRGQPTPVLDLTMLITGATGPSPRRYVTMRVDPPEPSTATRVMALAVDDVLSVREFDVAALAAMPALLPIIPPELCAAVGAFDRRLIPLLQALLHAAADDVPATVPPGRGERGRDA